MSDPEVLVVGAGPVGLTVAGELVRRGVRVRVVDGASGPATSSRALATHPRTLEICHQMEVLDDLLPRGRRVRHFTIHLKGRRLISFDADYSRMPTRFPFSLMVDQVVVEQVLRDALRRRGVEVEWGVELTEFDRRAAEVTARLRHAGGREERVVVPWLVGTDGAHSLVRRTLGIRLLGDATQTWLNADVVLDVDLPRDSNHLVHHGKGTLLLVPFPEPGKWRIVDTEDSAHAGEPDVVRNRLADKLSRALGRPVEVPPPSWLSVFTVQQRKVERMREGRCFVAGDAAHVHSPASGQGMNTGIQDGYNLAWKLADVVRGHAGEELLDSYSAERVPIGEKLLRSTRTATALVALRNALALTFMPPGLGMVNAIKPLKGHLERKLIRGFCGLTLSYPESPLSDPAGDGRFAPGTRVACDGAEESGSPGWRELCAELTDPRWTLLLHTDDATDPVPGWATKQFGRAVSVRVVSATPHGERPLADPGDVVRRAFGLSGGGYALVRPDGYLAAKGTYEGTASLAAVLTARHLIPADENAGLPA
ncbi:FAD-dependent monooxygenase [Amycolatopsis samaneae]|uniref:FAD-dependent monooxygenase n=1 Tax=Amycolatopsis samaneae TaxID=664691 RepID=A0ABW5GS33_9PSEU